MPVQGPSGGDRGQEVGAEALGPFGKGRGGGLPGGGKHGLPDPGPGFMRTRRGTPSSYPLPPPHARAPVPSIRWKYRTKDGAGYRVGNITRGVRVSPLGVRAG